jgi:hypothetical protein
MNIQNWCDYKAVVNEYTLLTCLKISRYMNIHYWYGYKAVVI